MKILHLDIETAPSKAYIWGLFNQNISINQIAETGYTLCWAAKWHGKGKVMFDSVHKSKPKDMMKKLHSLLEEADAVCHYNGQRFDIPTVNREFLLFDMLPPSPYKQIDLLRTCRGKFRFQSNKLDFVSQQLGIGAKTAHKGMGLWKDCMDGDDKAWRVMERYNKQDVKLLESLYKKLLPWIENHPNMALYSSTLSPICKNCGSHKLQRRGTAKTLTHIYPRFQCSSCGTWQRGKSTLMVKEKEVLK
jgi:DNA polymerase elongation subunit (family B)